MWNETAAEMQQTPTGRESLAQLAQTGADVQFGNDGTSSFQQPRNTILIDSHEKWLRGVERPVSAERRAAALVHETEHARSWQDGGSNLKPMKIGEDAYVNTMFDEEARAESRSIRFLEERPSRDRAGDARSVSEGSYRNAQRAARQDALAAGATPAEADRAGHEAGGRAVRADVPTWSNGTMQYDPYYRQGYRRAAFETFRRGERQPERLPQPPPEPAPISTTLQGLLRGGGIRA
jgi:hypothetical protein